MEKFKFVKLCFVFWVFSLSVSAVYGATFVVDSLGNLDNGASYTPGDGTNTLRKCIRLANSPGADTINFGVSGTITATSALPIITDNETIIDASSQWNGVWPGGQPGITLKVLGSGLVISGANNCHIRGLFITECSHGIQIINGSKNNVIGGTGAGYRNVISKNAFNGILIEGDGTNNNIVSGNYIGTNVNGTAALGNLLDGVAIHIQAKSNIIGGTTSEERNIISGNKLSGVDIANQGTSDNKVSGNYIGTDISGTSAIENKMCGVRISSGAHSNIIGGNTPGERNIISGNGTNGVSIWGINYGANNNKVSGNYIGTDVTGTVALGNAYEGVIIYKDAKSNTIGGTTAGERNVISGNKLSGISLFDSVENNKISGNFIGTDATGNSKIGNLANGISIGYNAYSNFIGGATAGERNIISGNTGNGIILAGPGISNNRVSGNYIGTDVNGTAIIGNSMNGAVISYGAQSNIIGGTTAGERNIISGNSNNGIVIEIEGTINNKVTGNYIGTDVNGNFDLGNLENGVYISNFSQLNDIGGLSSGERNVISGNDGSGVLIEGTGTISNTVKGNYIGTKANGTEALGNTKSGVSIVSGAQLNTIGGIIGNAGNTIAFNGESGVYIDGAATIYNRISQNSMWNNSGLGIDLTNGGNNEIPSPTGNYTLVGNNLNIIGSGAGPNSLVEVFKADSAISGEGKLYLGSLIANTSGNFLGNINVAGSGVSSSDSFVATTTYTNTNTSEFGLLNPSITSPVVVSITRMDPSPTKSKTVRFMVTFSKNVSGVDASDFVLVKTGTANGIISSVSASVVATVTVSNVTGDGTLGLNLIDDDSIRDNENVPLGGIGPGNGNFTTGEIYTIDNTPPTVSIGPPSVSVTQTGPVSYTVTYSGADTINLTISNVALNKTGTAHGIVSVSNGTTSSPKVTISNITGEGTLGISIHPGTSSDTAGNIDTGAGPSTTFSVRKSTTNCIILKEGWNLISLIGDTCFYEGQKPDLPNCISFVDVVNTLGKINLEDWFDSVINPKDAWITVFGFQYFMSRGMPHNVNTLRSMSPFDGFWVKIKKGIGDATLCIENNPFQAGCGIDLTKGWNLVGFPINKGFYDSDSHPDIPWISEWEKVPYPVGESVFWSIYDNISFIFSGSESFNPLLSKQANSLHNISGGSGYWIKLKNDDKLIYGPKP